ncbi:MAG: Ribonuclease 3 [Candidatus Anoxychlamydiales bacterium]|nr:Ribonuclease 3 [Candidatus Anoxychlamydiales bacterium]
MNEYYELKDNLSKIEKIIKISFTNKDLLLLSFVHRSFVNENKKIVLLHNERLEFLGDSALNLIISTYLYKKLSKHTEGELSHIRSRLVDGSSCAKYYEILGLEKYMLLSRGEKEAKRGKIAIYSDAFEALVGAIYLDKGIEICQKFLLDNFSKLFDEMCLSPEIDYKGKLQEFCQKKYQKPPEYKVLKEKGPQHQKIFQVAVFVNDKKMGLGIGPSKKAAEQIAAEDAYNNLNLKNIEDDNG